MHHTSPIRSFRLSTSVCQPTPPHLLDCSSLFNGTRYFHPEFRFCLLGSPLSSEPSRPPPSGDIQHPTSPPSLAPVAYLMNLHYVKLVPSVFFERSRRSNPCESSAWLSPQTLMEHGRQGLQEAEHSVDKATVGMARKGFPCFFSISVKSISLMLTRNASIERYLHLNVCPGQIRVPSMHYPRCRLTSLLTNPHNSVLPSRLSGWLPFTRREDVNTTCRQRLAHPSIQAYDTVRDVSTVLAANARLSMSEKVHLQETIRTVGVGVQAFATVAILSGLLINNASSITSTQP